MEKTILKKILLAIAFIGMTGILVAGAVNRTMDRVGRVAEAHGHGYGHGHDEADECAESESGQGYGWGNSEAGGWGHGRDGYGQANVEEWLTLQGIVVSVDADTLVVRTTSGERVAMENRPWRFAQEQGFSAQVDDQVTLIGFYEGDHLEVGRIDNTTNGQTVLIREESAQPLWTGRGRHGG